MKAQQTTTSVTKSPRHPIIVSDEVTAAARAVLEAGLDVALITSPAARLLLTSVVLDDVLQAAFSASRIEVTAEIAAIVDERP